MQNMNKDWNRFMLEIQKSNQIVDQLSKLYIVLHEKVRKTIVKCTLDSQYDPTQQSHEHLQTILNLLTRLSNPNDAYLKGVEASILNKYEQQLVDLSQQIQKLLKGQMLAQSHDAKLLIGLKHVDNKQKFGLKDEIKQSENRILRSRSGKRSGRNKQKTDTNNLIEQFEVYKSEYLKKKARLQKQMQNHIEKKGNQVIFSKKYLGNNLQHYLDLKKDLLDLLLSEQHRKQIVASPLIDNGTKNKELNEGYEQKIFNQFKIKTKYMKKHVKENILEALADVKMKLLEQYHNSNIKKLNQGNPDTLIVLTNNQNKNTKSMTTLSTHQHKIKQKQIKSQLQQEPNRIGNQSTSLLNKNKTFSLFAQQKIHRYPMASKTYRPRIYEGLWNKQIEQRYLKGISDKLQICRVPN